MSSWPGPTLEDFLMDLYGLILDSNTPGLRAAGAGRRTLTYNQFALLVAIYEPDRERIENLLWEYSEEGHGSWRDFKYMSIGPGIPDEIDETAGAYLDALWAPKMAQERLPESKPRLPRMMRGADLGLPNEMHYALWRHCQQLAHRICTAIDNNDIDAMLTSGDTEAYDVAAFYVDQIQRAKNTPTGGTR